MASGKEGRGARRGRDPGRDGRGPGPGGRGGPDDAERRPRLVDVDPWAALLEGLLEEPAGSGGGTTDEAAAEEGGAGKGTRRRGG